MVEQDRKVNRKNGGGTNGKQREEERKRRKSGALFSFHDVQCQIELTELLFSVYPCSSFAMIIMLLTNTHCTYTHSYPPHTQS